MDKVGSLVLLVGENTLPNYLAAMVLKPRDKIFLFYSKMTKKPATEEPAKRLKKVLKERIKEERLEIIDCYIEEPWSASKVRAAYDKAEIPEGSHLNYTGGTTVMAVHIYEKWKKENNSFCEASYIDGENGKIYFTRGHSIDIDVSIDFETLFRLQGCEISGKAEKIDGTWKLDEVDRERVRTIIFGNKIQENDSKLLSQWMVSLLKIIKEASSENLQIILQPNSKMSVLVIKDYRLYAIGCTHSTQPIKCKNTMFEIFLEAEKLGGAQARSALVCLVDDKTKNILKCDGELMWESRKNMRIFAKRNLQEFLGKNFVPPKLTELENWLHS